jgi:hypothetical protein
MTNPHQSEVLEELFAEAGIIRNALMVGDHDDAREWTLDLARRAKALVQLSVTAAALCLAADLGPVGSGRAHGFGPALAELSDAFDQAADR